MSEIKEKMNVKESLSYIFIKNPVLWKHPDTIMCLILLKLGIPLVMACLIPNLKFQIFFRCQKKLRLKQLLDIIIMILT